MVPRHLPKLVQYENGEDGDGQRGRARGILRTEGPVGAWRVPLEPTSLYSNPQAPMEPESEAPCPQAPRHLAEPGYVEEFLFDATSQ